MPIDKEALDDSVRKAIQKARLSAEGSPSQTELGRRINASRATISNIERGAHGVTIDMLFRIGAALGIEPTTLLPDLNRVRTAKTHDEPSQDLSDPKTLPGKWSGAIEHDEEGGSP